MALKLVYKDGNVDGNEGSVNKILRAGTVSEHRVLRPKLSLAIKIDRNQEGVLRPKLKLDIKIYRHKK